MALWSALVMSASGGAIPAPAPFADAEQSKTGYDNSRLVGISQSFFLELDRLTGAATPVSGPPPSGLGEVAGMAYDRNTDTIYAVDAYTDNLMHIDPATYEITVIGPTGLGRVYALAFDSNTNTLYAGEVGTDQLITIDPATGDFTVVGDFGFGVVSGLAFDPNSNTLYGADNEQLLTVDTTIGAATLIATMPDRIDGLAFDPDTNKLYGTAEFNHRLVTINRITGAFLSESYLPEHGNLGLAFDFNRDTVFVASERPDQLFAVDPATGGWSLLARLGYDELRGAVFNPLTNSIFAIFTLERELISIDLQTGAFTHLTDIALPPGVPPASTRALAYDDTSNALFGSIWANDGTDLLVTIDPATGESTLVDDFGLSEIECMTFDPDAQKILAIEGDTDQLISYELPGGPVSSVGPVGFEYVYGITLDRHTDTLYAVSDSDAGEVLIIDQTTGAATPTTKLTGYPRAGLAYDLTTDTLYGIGGDPDTLFTVDLDAGSTTTIGGLGSKWIDGLAYDPNAGTLYATQTGYNDFLLSINSATGAVTTIGPLGLGNLNVDGLAFDPNGNALYGVDVVPQTLLRIDTASGAAIPIGTIGFKRIAGLAYDQNSDTLYGVDYDTDQLVTIDTASGVGTAVGSLGFGQVDGLAFDPYTDTLYGTDRNTAQLIVINTNTGAGTVVGRTIYPEIGGLAVIRPPDCNLNRMPDAEDVANETSADCNANGVPDECDVDCNANGVPDDCDLAAGTSPDCNANAIPDECDVASEYSRDCTGDGLPDECTVVCTDPCECYDADACTFDACRDAACANLPRDYGDIDNNGVIALMDLFCVLDGFTGDFSACTFENMDIEPCGGNGVITLADLFAVLDAFAGEDPCCGG